MQPSFESTATKVVNDVDTLDLRACADRLATRNEATVTLTLSTAKVRGFLNNVALAAETAQFGDFVAGLSMADLIVKTLEAG